MKKIVIIGGGIAGLTVGIYAQKNGFESVILEKHHTMGGECTGWDRQGYHIDGCIHWLIGTKEGTPINQVWKDVGALDGVDIINPESFMAVEYGGVTVHFYRDLERLQASWLEISPEDKDAIEEFCCDIKTLQSYDIPVGKPMDMMNILERVKLMLSMKDAGMIMQKYGKRSLVDYAQTFKNPALREALASFTPEGFSASSIFFALAGFTKGQAGIPAGGSKAMALRMAERYVELGGRIETASEVVELEIQGKSVRSATCANGKTFTADYFVAACDANVLYRRLLKGEYPDPKFEMRFNNPADYPLASNIYVGVGYQGSIGDIPRTLKFPVQGFEINQWPIKHLQMTHYDYEPGFAPEGHTAITFAINQFEPDLDAWEELAKDREAYRLEKDRIGAEVIGAMEKRFPEMKGKLKLLDVATPRTYVRYCNAYRGSFMGFWPTLRGKSLAHTGKIKGLDNIVLSGQWLQPPGGLPVALITGRDTIMRLCKQVKRKFVG
ncbi:MAG: NAD(P)/FAD-dependent oxidoreductase [Firmicutes bacterium]|nr:NAD(P)/FAD-dependent oxidoreductase [Bacillota bacterium]